ncbi:MULTISPECIES: inositol monophosphatase family protein [unclassified Serratia (in: enterobacteria)]|uniref:inositol monophosphatase family protein n=1 Tax=unclassified Serratia (in: enterobacteria) TaxID=2647522 RepID=UPI0005062DFE|nr:MULTISPECIES: inositol monophosphatase family protein [unclassified Serratia (in: enterobacteria)]KFK92318.1 phosphatase [Serratia sp. Ag2]KFK96066.1 phosphatase [Serratia sp. Ag1]
MELKHFTRVAESIADQTRQLIKQERQRYLYGGREFETKDDLSPVTQIDQQVEQLIREQLNQAFPSHGILGEEFGAEAQNEEWVWVIDPIDGTKQFIAGVPVYGTLLALCHHGQPVVGIIDIPALDERWVGITGQPSTLNGHPITTRPCLNLAEALMSTSNTEFVLPEHRAGYNHLLKASKWRIYGAACYAYGCLAAGRIDLSVDSGGMREVDYCAMVPIIEGAGGKITDWHGEPLTMYSKSTVVAAGDPRLHAQVLATLSHHGNSQPHLSA